LQKRCRLKFRNLAITTAKRHVAKIENARAARVVMVANWAFDGLQAQLAKLQL
jgi:hypothetical protein